jgi:hypothetical protein
MYIYLSIYLSIYLAEVRTGVGLCPHSLHGGAPEYSRRTRHGLPRRRTVGCPELAGGFGPYWRGCSRVLEGTPRRWQAEGGLACAGVVRRRVRVRCRGQQRVPGGLRADRDRGRVPHRGGRRGQDPVVAFRGDRLCLPARLHLRHRLQPCVLQHARGRRRRLLRAAAVRRRDHRYAHAEPLGYSQGYSHGSSVSCESAALLRGQRCAGHGSAVRW